MALPPARTETPRLIVPRNSTAAPDAEQVCLSTSTRSSSSSVDELIRALGASHTSLATKLEKERQACRASAHEDATGSRN